MAKPRIGPKFNVSLPDDVLATVDEIRGTKPRSAMARELIIEALALRAAIVDGRLGNALAGRQWPDAVEVSGDSYASAPVIVDDITQPHGIIEWTVDPTVDVATANPPRQDADLYRIHDIDGEKIRIGFRCDKDQHARCRAEECECTCHVER